MNDNENDPGQRGTVLLIRALVAALRLKSMACDLGYEPPEP